MQVLPLLGLFSAPAQGGLGVQGGLGSLKGVRREAPGSSGSTIPQDLLALSCCGTQQGQGDSAWVSPALGTALLGGTEPCGELWAAAEGLKALGCRGRSLGLSPAHQYIEYPLIWISGLWE